MADNHSCSGNESDVAESSISAFSVHTGEEKTRPSAPPSKSSKRSRTPRASKKDLDLLSSKVDKIFEYFEMMKDTAVQDRPRPFIRETAVLDRQRPIDSHEDTALQQRPTVSIPVESHGVQIASTSHTQHDMDDVLSIQPGQREVVSLLGSDDGEKSNKSEDCDIEADRFMKYSANSKRLLMDMFGVDAVTKPTRSSVGISLDDTQIDVIKESWRSEDPNRLTAFKESYRTAFPISDKDEDLLKVPSLDDIIEHLLLKRYGSKAMASSSLHSQPFKSIEKLAFQGQLSARMGLIINVYIQQALGNLLSLLQEKDTNIDQCIQCVRDIFAMSTKMLDQSARSGSFHHLVRRRTAMADTGLHDFKDLKTAVWALPLSHTGVFGDGLEKKLKDRQELNKQIGDLIPEMGAKRKSFPSEAQNKQTWKRPRFTGDKPYTSSYQQRKPQFNRNSSYTIPRRTAPSATVTSKSAPVSTFRTKFQSK